MPRISITVFSDNNCSIPQEATEFIKFFQSKLSTIPKENLPDARIRFEASDWELETEISYTREKTEAEIIADAEFAEQARERKVLRKREQLRILKKELDEL
jgi:hypothetical protein